MIPPTPLTIPQIVEKRGITEVVHFTTNLGFLGCLAKNMVLPRNRLARDQLLEHILTLNAPFRSEEEPSFDQSEDWIDYVNLSISEISFNLFKHSLKWHAGRDIFWVIMSFEPQLLADAGVYFSTTNNIYELTCRAIGPAGLEACFAPSIPRKSGWIARRGNRAPHLTTCEQCEVLYPKGLSLKFLQKVYVRDGEEGDAIYSMLNVYSPRAVEVVLNKEKFRGAPN